MDRMILIIVVIVALVGVVGLFSNYNFGSTDALTHGSLTGNAVAGTGDCTACAGFSPVCARLNHRLLTFENACSARCAGATIVRDSPCERI